MHDRLNLALAVVDAVVLVLAVRRRLPSFALQRAVAVYSGYLYWKAPGHAWIGTSAAVPGLVELLAAVEAVWLVCWTLPGWECYPARAFSYLIGLTGAAIALFADPVPYAYTPAMQWYARTLLHVQETLMCSAAFGYVVTSGSIQAYSKGLVTDSPALVRLLDWRVPHAYLMAIYLGTDAWANVQPAARWAATDAVLMWIHLGCAAGWILVLALGVEPSPRSNLEQSGL